MKKKTYNHIARLYDVLDLPFEFARYRPLRRLLFEGLKGDLLDAGVGTGRNFPFYPDTDRRTGKVTGKVTGKATGIDLSPAMLARARMRKEELGTRVDLHQMDVMELDFADDSFDSIVSTFLFCVLDADDQQPALKELCRVCRPDGTICILEYAMSEKPVRRFVMKLWAPWVRFAYGAAFDRNTQQYLSGAGLELIEETFVFKDIIKLLKVRPRAGAPVTPAAAK